MTISGLDYKHNHIYSNGIMFENHRYLTSFKGKNDIRRLEKILQNAIKEGNFAPFGDAGFYALSPTANALYITYHSFFHFLIEGITLRHLLDWALFVKAEQDTIDWIRFYSICDDLGFSRFANTLNAIAADVWGIFWQIRVCRLTAVYWTGCWTMCWPKGGTSADCPSIKGGRY